MIRAAKSQFFRLSRFVGFDGFLANSGWRRRRLLILGYHGVSLDDEHEWDPALFMQPRTLRRRFEIIREMECTVLGLSEALQRLNTGQLPERAVVLTFDDGLYDFHKHVLPLAREFAYPVTVYQSTYYSLHPVPVFPVMLGYLLWKGDQRVLSIRLDAQHEWSLSRSNREVVRGEILAWVVRQELSAPAKNDLLEHIAERLGLPYADILGRRILQLMTPNEIADVSAGGASVEMHTHRHRSPTDRPAFEDEIITNRDILEEATGRRPVHFCYPSGRFDHQFYGWLRSLGVESAVIGSPGLAPAGAHPYTLPRFIDTEAAPESTFRAWLSGVADMVPRRTVDHSIS